MLYDRQDRAGGAPKQTLGRLVKYALDGMFSFSNRPLRAVTYAGFVVSVVTFVLAMFYLITFFTMHKEAGSGFTTIILCVLFLGGVQLISIGILGEYIGRIYEEVKQRPLYVVRETLGFDQSPAENAFSPQNASAQSAVIPRYPQGSRQPDGAPASEVPRLPRDDGPHTSARV